jgi:hypothetical protein
MIPASLFFLQIYKGILVGSRKMIGNRWKRSFTLFCRFQSTTKDGTAAPPWTCAVVQVLDIFQNAATIQASSVG